VFEFKSDGRQGNKQFTSIRLTLDLPRKQVREKQSARRASNKGFLPMTLDLYLKLLDWTGRQLRKDKAGRIPAEFEAILERLDCSAESWLDLVQNFRKRFRTEAGLVGQRQFWRKPSVFATRSGSEGLSPTRSLAYASGYYFRKKVALSN